jgi:membrane protein required for colicin V production
MAWVDYVIIGIVVLSALISLLRGFIREAFSLAIWMLAFWISWSFFRELAVQLQPWIETPSVRLGVAFAALMLGSLAVGGLVNYLVIQLVERTGLSGTDRLVGMVFGMARGVLLVTVLVWLAGLTPIPQDPWWRESHLVPYFEELALWLRQLLPEDIAERFQYAALGRRLG